MRGKFPLTFSFVRTKSNEPLESGTVAHVTSTAGVFRSTRRETLSRRRFKVSIGIKRLHDRGKRGYSLLLFYPGPVVLGMIRKMAGSIGPMFELASSLQPLDANNSESGDLIVADRAT